MSRPNSEEWRQGMVISANNLNNIENAIDHLDNEIKGARGYGDSATGTLGSRIDDLVMIQDTKPSSANNEIWVRSTNAGVQVPTYEEFEELAENTVHLDAQTIEDSQKAQARTNIGAASAADFNTLKDSQAVRYDAAQSLTDAQKIQARSNIGVASSTDVTTLVGTVNTLKDNQAVRYDVAQNLTETQKVQARTNIGVTAGAVLYSEEQTLTDAQKGVARGNIEAASTNEVADLKGALDYVTDATATAYGTNFFDPFALIQNKDLGTDGVVVDSVLYDITDFIDVGSNTQFTFKLFDYRGAVSFTVYQYSSNTEASFIKRTGNSTYLSGRSVILESTTKYIRFRLEKSAANYINPYKVMAVWGNATITDFIPYYTANDKTAREMIADVGTLHSDTLSAMMKSVGYDVHFIHCANINNVGVIEYSALWNVMYIRAKAETVISQISVGEASERLCYAFYASEPDFGSQSINKNRYITASGTYKQFDVIVPNGAYWFVLRYKGGDIPTIKYLSDEVGKSLLGGVQDMPDTYGVFSGKAGVLSDAADDGVMTVNYTYLNAGDIVRISNKNMFEFQQTWDDITRSNVRFIVDRNTGAITVKTTGSVQTSSTTSQKGDSEDHIVTGQNGKNLHCLFSFKFQKDTVVSISGNPDEPFAYRDSCQLQVTDGSDDMSHIIYDRGNGITMIAKAGVDYGVRIAVVITEKTGAFESDDGITFHPQVEIGPKVTPFVLHQGMDVEYTGADISGQLRTYAPVTTIVVESATNGGIILHYRKATLAKRAIAANAAAQKLATLPKLHKYSQYTPMVTFIDDDTTNIDSVVRYHDIMQQLGVVGNYACIATNIDDNSISEDENERMDSLLQKFENEGFGMLFHCDLQRGTETEYFLPDNRRDIMKCRKNVLDGLRKMRKFGLNNYMHWVTPYGVNDADIQDIARQAGLDCIITTDTQSIVGNNANADRYNLPRLSFTMNENANSTIRRIKAVVDAAKETSGWVLITTHAYEWPETIEVTTDDGETTEIVTPETLMTRLISYITQSQHIDVVSFQTAWERRKQMFYLNEAFGNL